MNKVINFMRGLGWKVLVIIVLAIVAIVCAVSLRGFNHSTGITVDSTAVSQYKKADKAQNAGSQLTITDDTVIELDSTAANLQRVTFTFTPQTSGNSITVANDDTTILNNFTISEDKLTITFDANELFEENQDILVEVDFNGSVDSYGSDITTRYFVMSVGESEKTDDDVDVSQTDDTESNDGLSAVIAFNGWTVPTYTDPNEAIANANGLASAELEVSVTPGSRVRKVNISAYKTDGTDLGDEWFIWSEEDWTATMDMSQYAGQTIVIKITLVSTDFAPEQSYRYFAVTVGSDLASEVEEAETTASVESSDTALTQSSNETDDGSLTVGISFNDVEISIFDSIEQALETPVKVSSSSITVKMDTSEAVKAVQISTYDADGTAHDDETIVWSDDSWQYKLSLKDYTGQTIIVKVTATDMESKNATRYFAVSVAE